LGTVRARSVGCEAQGIPLALLELPIALRDVSPRRRPDDLKPNATAKLILDAAKATN
jgi:hypothetical protein